MRPEQVDKWLSAPRFRAYSQACEGDHDRAVALYNWNAEVSAAFMEVLYHLEILLRNAIDRQFPQTDADHCLSICVPSVWLCDPDVLTDESRGKVNDGIARLSLEGKQPTRGRVIGSLTFGFWGALFSGRYEGLWRTRLLRAFPNGNGRRREINELATVIQRFRNRVAHHEAVFSIDLSRKLAQHLQLAGLIDTEAQTYIANLSRVEKLLLEKP
ncbi:MAG TPA: hypothetical protein VFY48_09575 [Solirubrobacterales bacterium]|nr:hypothetical protein [Solirubrobacterales bacterium]